MSKFLFVVIQLPFADYRRFTAFPPDVVSRPSWPKPTSNEFVRRFGGVRSRIFADNERGSINSPILTESTERYFVKADQHIIEEKRSLLPFNVHASIKPCFLRVVGNQQALVRFELGLLVSANTGYWHNKANLDNCISSISREKIYFLRESVSRRPSQPKPLSLSSLGANLRRRYFTASERHDGSGTPFEFSSQLLRSLDWSVVAVLPSPKHYRWLAHDNLINVQDSEANHDGIAIAYRKSPNKGNSRFSPSYAVVGNFNRKEQPDARRFRIGYLRLRAELQALWAVVGEIRENGLLSDYVNGGSSGETRTIFLERYLESSINRIMDTLDGQKMKVPNWAFAAGLWQQDLGGLEAIELLNARCSHLISDGLSRRTAEALELAARGAHNSFYFGRTEVIQGDRKMSKYNFEGHTNVGSVGDAAVATNFSNSLASGSASKTELAELSQQLEVLIAQIRVEYSEEPDAAVAMINLENAKEAANKGEQFKVLRFLQAAGHWTLDKASTVGVPVAIAALKKALGV